MPTSIEFNEGIFFQINSVRIIVVPCFQGYNSAQNNYVKNQNKKPDKLDKSNKLLSLSPQKKTYGIVKITVEI